MSTLKNPFDSPLPTSKSSHTKSPTRERPKSPKSRPKTPTVTPTQPTFNTSPLSLSSNDNPSSRRSTWNPAVKEEVSKPKWEGLSVSPFEEGDEDRKEKKDIKRGRTVAKIGKKKPIEKTVTEIQSDHDLVNNTNILLLTCGGSITQTEVEGKVDQILSGDRVLEDIKWCIPGNITTKSICENMTSTDAISFIFKIRQKIFKMGKEYKAFIITVSTDFIEEVSFLLDRLLDGHLKRAVIVTGSMNAYGAVGYDGLSNLRNAAIVALNSDASQMGVLVVMKDDIFCARYVYREDTKSLNSFHSSSGGPVGQIRNGKPVFFYNKLPPFEMKEIVGAIPKELTTKHIAKNILIWELGLNFYIDSSILGDVDGVVVVSENTNVSQKILDVFSVAKNVVLLLPKYSVLLKETIESYDLQGFNIKGYQNLNPIQARIILMLNLGIEKWSES